MRKWDSAGQECWDQRTLLLARPPPAQDYFQEALVAFPWLCQAESDYDRSNENPHLTRLINCFGNTTILSLVHVENPLVHAASRLQSR